MPRYVVTLDAPPPTDHEQDVVELQLQLSADGEHHRNVSVRINGVRHVEATDELWRAAVFYAVEELSLAVKGDVWGAPAGSGPGFVLDVTADDAARFIGEPSAGVSLDAGAVVGEFVA